MMPSSRAHISKSFLYKHLNAAGISILMATLFITGCQSSAESRATISNLQTSSSSVQVIPDMNQQTLEQQALHIQRALASNDFTKITNNIHPTRGVRLSMYAYVRPEADKVFSREQYAQYLQQSKIRFTWGEKDGTGDLLVTPLPEYLNTWVNAKNYSDSTISINEFRQTGGMINNLRDVYQKSDVVEFYYKGSDEYAGMDWRIMRLVFDSYQGKRYLVAIINDQWTV